MHYGNELRGSLWLLLAGLVLGVVAAIMVPSFHHRENRGRAYQRMCFANQKTLAGALEMYELDYDTRVEVVDSALLETFREHGYLQYVPDDPGVGRGAQSNYFLYRSPRGRAYVMCLRHGFVVPPSGARPGDVAARQLAALGVDPGRHPVGGVAATPSGWTRNLSGLWDLANLMVALVAVLVFWFGALRLLVFVVHEAVAWLSHGAPSPAPPPSPGAVGSRVDLTQAKCPVCADGFGEGTPLASLCPTCRTPHHEPCLRYIGHCAVFACSRTELTERRRQEAIEEKAKTATG